MILTPFQKNNVIPIKLFEYRVLPYLDKITNMLSLKLNQLIIYLSEEIFNITIHIPEYAMKLLLASILAFYLIKEGPIIRDTFVGLLPENKKDNLLSFTRN